MKVEFLVENIENYLPVLSKILPLHSQIPVLSNILLVAAPEGLFIYATNLDIGVRIKIPAKIEEKGATTIPGKQFIETISSLPKDKVEMVLEKESLVLRSRNNKIVFQTIAREEFPNIFEQKGEKIRTFAEGELGQIFSKLVFAVSSDDSRPELTGILLSQKGEDIDFVATDGFRLSLKRLKNKKIFDESSSLILPARLISEAILLKAPNGIKMYIYKKANQVIFETEDVILVGRLINGEFPNYERVIPEASHTKINLDTEEFMQKLKIASVFARESANIVKVNVAGGKVKIHARSSGLGEGEVILEGEQEGEDNEIAFNIKFLSDLLKNLPDTTVSMELLSSIEPTIFKTEEDPDFLHIIMPVRVQE